MATLAISPQRCRTAAMFGTLIGCARGLIRLHRTRQPGAAAVPAENGEQWQSQVAVPLAEDESILTHHLGRVPAERVLAGDTRPHAGPADQVDGDSGLLHRLQDADVREPARPPTAQR